MRFHHGFQLPDKKYLVDEDGLLKYLGVFTCIRLVEQFQD